MDIPQVIVDLIFSSLAYWLKDESQMVAAGSFLGSVLISLLLKIAGVGTFFVLIIFVALGALYFQGYMETVGKLVAHVPLLVTVWLPGVYLIFSLRD